jgi:hypothetical protein
MPGSRRRLQLRTRVLAGVLAVTLLALAAFDVAAVSALRRYLVSQTDSRLLTVLSLYRPLILPVNVSVGPQLRSLTATPRKPEFVKDAKDRTEIIGPRLQLPAALGQYYVGYWPPRPTASRPATSPTGSARWTRAASWAAWEPR